MIQVLDDETWQIPNAEYFELKPKKSKYCIVIPVINEGERLKKQLDSMKNIVKDIDVIITDGGSTDGSNDIDYLKSMGIRSLLIKRDEGKLGAQYRIGFAYALREGYKGIITVDGNNKDGIEAIYDFIKELDAGYDFVQGSRYVKGGQAVNTPFMRAFAVKLIHAPLITLIARFCYTDTTNGFRAYSRTFLLDSNLKPFRDIFKTYELQYYFAIKAPRLGYKTKEIPVTRRYPKSGPIPTKISHFSGNLQIIKILIKLCMGIYDSKK